MTYAIEREADIGGGGVQHVGFLNEGGGGGGYFAAPPPIQTSGGYVAPAGYGSGIVTPYLGGNNDTRAVGAAFDNNARAVVSYYSGLARQTTISDSDFQRAQAAYNDLELFASEHGIEYVRRQWASREYRPAFLSWLEQLRAKLGLTPTPTDTPEPNGTKHRPPTGGPLLPPVTEDETPTERLADLLSAINGFAAGTDSEPRTMTTYTPAAGASSGTSGVLIILVIGAVVVGGYLYFKKKGGGSNE